MIKLFISLFFMVLSSVLIFLLFFIILLLLEKSFGDRSDVERRVAVEVFDLLDKSIEGLSNEEIANRIKQYQQSFGPNFALIKLSDVNFNAKQKQMLLNNKAVYIEDIKDSDLTIHLKNREKSSNDGEINLIFRKHLNSNLVWKIHIDTSIFIGFNGTSITISLEGHNFINGVFSILEEDLTHLNEPLLTKRINALEESFDLSLKFLNKEKFSQSLIKRPELEASFKERKVIDISPNKDHAIFVRSFINPVQILQIGPIKLPWFTRNILFLLVFSFVFALATALFIWLWPLWFNLLKIKNAAYQFGEGNYKTRIPYRKKSALAPIVKSFNAMAKRTEDSINTQKELTTAVSHELRTPIARMSFALEMLKESSSNMDKNRYIENLYADIDDLELLLEELLNYARFDQKDVKLNLNLEPIDPWIRNTMGKLIPLKNSKEFTYKILNINKNERAYFEPRSMSRVLDNLIQNALRYATSTVLVTFNKANQDYVITVEDDGYGISEEDKIHIFDAFSRIDTSRNKSTGGFGLGLAIASRIMNAHKGTINIRTSELDGACFEVRWPINSNLN